MKTNNNDRRADIGSFMMALVAMVLVVGGPVPAAQADDLASDARAFVQQMADTAIVKLTEPDIERDERKVRMRNLMQDYFFVPGIGQWVMGRNWRKASKAEQEEFLTLFEGLIVETYVDRFASYDGETLMITKSDIRGKKDAIVSSTLNRPSANKDIRLDWRVRRLGDSYKIIDIMVEDVSMGQTMRSDFAAAIKDKENDIGKFLEDLRQKVDVAESGA